ncbi:hypothetical protein HII31_07224 [Pseudocercospora fuligena]|uniref:Uncharacterized protein n=1 Tax=Pseudocercospora fuligena TaxID=685502 RepID=A0A8H6RHJ5_9PEZI|nr:hypothetical protein HII31_07224 [Pseudocercospora fuligena]
MQPILTILSLMAASTALADIQIYSILNTPTGGGGAGEGYKFYSSQPDCNAPGNAIFHAATDDASSGGVRCEGCNGDQAIADWDIAEFEWNISEGHFTVYSPDYTITPADGSASRGTCRRDSGHDYNCPVAGPLGQESGVRVFICETDLDGVE